tara:strand:+ start:498 stop:1517 length:1020 start_codon:yes stop_codon:yes gene_type:complete
MSRIRANTITNQNANGAPNFPDGITVTGVVTATTTNQNITGDLTVTGNVGVGGTITYEDVTNIDSVGVVTARSGIKIGPTAGVAGTFFADGSYVTAGVITATTFHGNGAQLTGISVDPSATASSAGFLKVLNATTPQIRLSNNASDNDDQQRSFFGIATGTNNFITGSTANDTVLRARAGGDLLIGVGSTIRMRVDELGRVTKPAQPCFSGINATGSGSGSGGTAEKMKYRTSGAMNFANVGDMHNISNGRFTVPVAGNYIFFFTNLQTGDKYSHLYKNGSMLGGSGASLGYTGDGGYNDLSAGGIVTLAANDYVQFAYEGSGSTYQNEHGSCFFALLS